MRIAVCDDDHEERLRITALLEEYKSSRNENFSYTAFQSATELLVSADREEYDLFLLDILMPGFNGLQTAREIRTFNDTVNIVFLTSTAEFAVESYQVRALNYLLKPSTSAQLFPLLDKLMEEQKTPEPALSISTQSRVFRLPYHQIEYVEVNAKTLYFHLINGSCEETPGSLRDYEAVLLARPGFVKAHRSYLVNLQWVSEIQKGALITHTGMHIPVSRSAYTQVRQAYMAQMFREGHVE